MVQQGEVEKTTRPGRRYELDWLRVLAFGLLIFYHIGMYYVSDWGWHIKSQHQSEWLQNIMMWSSQWRMSLLFLISGCAVAFLLRKMRLWNFYWSRYTRLLLPLFFGMAVVVVPQVYAEMASQGRLVDVGYWQFWLAYLDQGSALFVDNKTVGEWHVTWNHLWFLMYIYVYSVAAWAICLLFKLLNLTGFWSLIEKRVGPVLMILGVPITLLSLNGQLLYESYPPSNDFINDYFNHGRYFMVFVMGIVFVRAPGYWRAVRQLRKPMLAAALVSFAFVQFLFHGGAFGGDGFAQALENIFWSSNGWLWILAICGWAQHLLNKDNAVIRYLNGGVYCYYILHQTVIIVLAYHLAPLDLGPVLEPISLVVLTLLACLGAYEVLRCIPGLRICFGITGGRNPGPSSEEISRLPSNRESPDCPLYPASTPV
ncbi:MAG: acyltransferase family protein [Halioglobus sp.]